MGYNHKDFTMKQNQSGFTVVELLVTIIVTALFVGMFYQVYTILVQTNATARRDARAGDLAFSNLRRYTSASSTGIGSCPGASPVTPLQSLNVTKSDFPELGTVTEKVTASCQGSSGAVLVVSELTYNNNNSRATYATYVN